MLHTCSVCGKIGPERQCDEHRATGGHWSPNRDSNLQAAFRKAVLARDHNRCTNCGATTKLIAHHTIPLRNFAKNDPCAYDPKHGITVCESCDLLIDPHARHQKLRQRDSTSVAV